MLSEQSCIGNNTRVYLSLKPIWLEDTDRASLSLCGISLDCCVAHMIVCRGNVLSCFFTLSYSLIHARLGEMTSGPLYGHLAYTIRIGEVKTVLCLPLLK